MQVRPSVLDELFERLWPKFEQHLRFTPAPPEDDLVFRREWRVVRGIHEEFQGIVDFTDFNAYFKKWIQPNILGDLETVFVGARQNWENRNPKPGDPGRGDFFMAVALFAALEHLGGFMAESSAIIDTAENIARVAQRLHSTRDVYAIVAKFGRNALVHGGWPQTAVAMPKNGKKEWAFGLSFNANSNPMRHDTLHASTVRLSKLWVPGRSDDDTDEELWLLKLVLNVQMLRWELLEFIDSEEYLRIVSQLPDTFDRVKRISAKSGIPWAIRSEEKKGKPVLCTDETLERQINALKAEWKRINPENKSDKFRRDHLGDIKHLE